MLALEVWRRLHISFLEGRGCSHVLTAAGASGPSSGPAGPCAPEASELEEMPRPETTGRSSEGLKVEVTERGLLAMV